MRWLALAGILLLFLVVGPTVHTAGKVYSNDTLRFLGAYCSGLAAGLFIYWVNAS